MKILLVATVLLAAFVITYTLWRLYRRKPKKPLKQGDYVMLRGRYKKDYPGVPTTHALVVENLDGDMAVVVFMDTQNRILKASVPLHVLCRAS